MKIGIFDFDQTLYEGYARYELGFAMEKAGLIRAGFTTQIEALQTSYEDGQITYNQKFDDDKKIFSGFYEGVSQTSMDKFMREQFRLEEKIFPWAKDLINDLQNKGYLTVVISGCWDFIIEYAQEILNFDSYFASSFQLVEGMVTGRYNKIIDYKMKQHYSDKLLEGCENSIGLGDSEADLVFLRKVSHGFLFEPSPDALKLSADDKLTLVNRGNVIEKIMNVA